MLQCLDGVKHLCGVLLKCCDIDLNQPNGLEDLEVLARETCRHPASGGCGVGACRGGGGRAGGGRGQQAGGSRCLDGGDLRHLLSGE
ncbi:hypothetical protein BAE44_0012988 [Dichanthelium oligosanthes]|uniref:Uncharacterized protein n=1 Tax=Dichanthelium oligosanthes TaxID=888268 RepID=A0A1E5VLI1_9POAL|nr:hypothetical protein BAE44_0012988 [Dichanthelium oligosanthes]